MIREEKKTEVEEEIRKHVDNLMREELDLLKAVTSISDIKSIQIAQKRFFRLLRGTRERRGK